MAFADLLPYPVRLRVAHGANRADRDGLNTLEITDERNGTMLI